MKPYKKFLKTIPMKLYLLITAFIVLAFFSNDFGLVDIQKTAIILAVGVDKTQEGFTVVSEISVPKGSDRTTGGTSSVNVTCEGKTVSDCISQIYTKTGWVPKLVFCNLIAIGEQTAREDLTPALDYFLRNEYVSDNCNLVVCEKKASDIFSKTSAIDDTPSLAITKLFSSAAEKAGRVRTSTLREFAIGLHGVSQSGYIPYLSATEQSEEQSSPTASTGEQSQEQDSEQTVYQAPQTALFTNGKLTALLTEEETFALNLIQGKVQTGVLISMEGEKPVALTVLKNDGNVNLKMKGAPKAVCDVSLTVRIYDRGTLAPINDLARSKPSQQTLDYAYEKINQAIRSIWEKSKAGDCDLFELKTKLYRSSKRKFEEWKTTLLSVAELELHLSVSPIK